MILIRHGQSEFNAAHDRLGIDPGIADPRLTPLGRRQAQEAAKTLARQSPEIRLILASPYTRALETAAILAETLAVPIEIEPLIRERAAYSCDIGSPKSRLVEAWPALNFDLLPEIWWPEDEETHAGVGERCLAFRRKAVELPIGRIVLVSHWGFIHHLTGRSIGNGEILPFDPGAASR